MWRDDEGITSAGRMINERIVARRPHRNKMHISESPSHGNRQECLLQKVPTQPKLRLVSSGILNYNTMAAAFLQLPCRDH